MTMRGRQFLGIKNRAPKLRVLTDAFHEFFENDLTTSAAAISYYAMLMLFPLLILIISVSQSIVGGEQMQHLVIDRILAFLPGTRRFVRDSLENIEQIPPSAVVTCVILVFWAFSWIFTVIEKAINRIWLTRPRPFLHGRLLAVAMIGVLGLLLFASAILTSGVSMLQVASERLPGAASRSFAFATDVVWQLGFVVASLVVTTATFAIIYKLMPNATVHWIEVLPGALMTGVAWEALKYVFAYLLPVFLEEYRLLYGGAWLALVLLTWVYISSIVMLFGAQLTAVLHNRHEERSVLNSLAGISDVKAL
jgi:YihY family inner membrane protein